MAIMSAGRGGPAARLYHFKEMGLPILFGAAVLLGSATLLLFANVTALQSSLAGIDRTEQMLMQISELEKAVLSQEMTVRGLALTGDGRFRAFEARERGRLVQASLSLQGLTADDATRRGAYKRALSDVAANRDIFQKLAKPGPDQAAHVVQAILDAGVRESMRRARAGLQQLRERELKDLAYRQHQMTDQISRAFGMAVVIIIAAFCLGGIGVWALRLQTPSR